MDNTYDSDCESSMTNSSSSPSSASIISSENLLISIPENEKTFKLISKKFLDHIRVNADVVEVQKRNWLEDSVCEARVDAFRIYANALETKHGGKGGGAHKHVKFGWYCCGGDKHRITRILAYGFSREDLEFNNNGGIVLSPVDSPAISLEDTGTDGDGLRHMLLCRVLLGRPELVHVGSDQTHPSSREFDSGVDSYDNPKKYIIWSNNMNTHILPEFVVTFKVKSAQSLSKGVEFCKRNGMRMPTSPWISFPLLISILGKFLTRDSISLINKYHKDYKGREITRAEVIQKVRQIAGDELLIAVIKSFRGGLVRDFRVSNHTKN